MKVKLSLKLRMISYAEGIVPISRIALVKEADFPTLPRIGETFHTQEYYKDECNVRRSICRTYSVDRLVHNFSCMPAVTELFVTEVPLFYPEDEADDPLRPWNNEELLDLALMYVSSGWRVSHSTLTVPEGWKGASPLHFEISRTLFGRDTLGTRIYNCLVNYRFGKSMPVINTTMLIDMTERDLLRMGNIGRRSVQRIKNVLSKHGYSLREGD